MREIKFRGKKVVTNEWVYGDYVSVLSTDNDKIFPTIVTKEGWHTIDIETLGQYTGRKDRNGKEIYEGDILFKTHIESQEEFELDQKGVVKQMVFVRWDYEACGCVGYEAGMDGDWIELNNIEEFEVIGNEFDNPELKSIIMWG